MKNPKFSHAFEVAVELPASLMPLKRLAMNWFWTWNHEIRDLFRTLDKPMWDEVGHNPVRMLAAVPLEKWNRLAEDTVFVERVHRCEKLLNDYLASPTWFEAQYGKDSQACIAYFCAEFGISEGLPIYSGGLGILAGDHLKAASDLGLPLVGVGLLYARGYFRQRLTHDGWQEEFYPQYDYYQMPLTLVRGEDRKPLRVAIEFPDRTVTCQIWRADVGRVQLYLLDSNVLENALSDQGITDTLYGGDEEMRIRQEMILGLGGMRALKALGINPTVCHMNEGHAAFLSLERTRQFMEEQHCDFKTARQVISSGNVFTTHTPVPAGFDLFPVELIERYFVHTMERLNLSLADFMKFGHANGGEVTEPFNMAHLAMANANRVNGVSKLHAAVSREMFHERWANFPEDDAPIEPITNGIHVMTWVSRRMAALFDEYLGADWRRNPAEADVWKGVYQIPDDELWSALENQRGDLVRFIRKRLQFDLEQKRQGKANFGTIGGVLDPRILTIGFARRFATYKRASLLLTDRERLLKLLNHEEHPIQIIISGKAHPRDDGGKRLIQELVNFISEEGVKARMIFLEDYNMQVARALVQGVDVWLNNPRRPLEASGTSGMKVVANGGLNCSILDGWWDEAYTPEVGWAIGPGDRPSDENQQDWLDSNSLYSLLEHDIAPRFYTRMANGIPKAWLEMVKDSIASLAPQFSTARMVRDYAQQFYMPSSNDFMTRQEDGLSRAKAALEWRTKVQAGWNAVSIVEVFDTAKNALNLGQSFTVSAKLKLGDLSADDVRVEALIGRIGANRELSHAAPFRLLPVSQEGDLQLFEAVVPCEVAGPWGYTVRVVPSHADVAVPAELSLITWESGD